MELAQHLREASICPITHARRQRRRRRRECSLPVSGPQRVRRQLHEAHRGVDVNRNRRNGGTPGGCLLLRGTRWSSGSLATRAVVGQLEGLEFGVGSSSSLPRGRRDVFSAGWHARQWCRGRGGIGEWRRSTVLTSGQSCVKDHWEQYNVPGGDLSRRLAGRGRRSGWTGGGSRREEGDVPSPSFVLPPPQQLPSVGTHA